MNLRPYQSESLEATETGFETFQRQLGVLATGGGKTILFSHLALREHERGSKTLILAHREELVDQAIDKLYRSTGIIAGKEKAEWRAELSDPVVVASIQTMIGRLDRWPKDHFGLVVADEAHHSISDSWLTVLRHFEPAKILGVTATADRGDRRSLGEFYENIPFDVGMFDLINQGFLSPITVKSVPLKIDLSTVGVKAGDFKESELDTVLQPYLKPMARAIQEEAGFRRTLVFMPLRATSRDFVDACNEIGLPAAHVDGDSPDRKEILKAFAAGEYHVLSNAMLLTEGFDDTGIDCVVVARPTKSRSLYAQMVGRGTRLHPHKDNLLLLDFLWMHEKHKLMRPASLVSKDAAEEDSITKLFETKGGQGELDLQVASTMARQQRESKLAEELAEKAQRNKKFIDPDEFALLMNDHDLVGYEPQMKWEKAPITAQQRAMLINNGFNPEEIRGRGHATQLISAIIKRRQLQLCSPKQMRVLKRFGVANPETMTMQQASTILNARLGDRRQRP